MSPYIKGQNIPDYWKLKQDNPFTVEDVDFDSSETFNEEEKEILKQSLEEIKQLITNSDKFDKLQSETTIIKRLDYLSKAVERLSKTDWKSVAISSIITVSITLALELEKANFLISLFSKLWSTLQKLPPIF